MTDWSGSLAFPKFNASLGLLKQIDLVLNGTIRTTLTITNSSPSASRGRVMAEVMMTVLDPENLLASTGPQLDLFISTYNYNLAAGKTISSGLLTSSGSYNEQFTDPNLLTEFTGSGNIFLSANTLSETWASNSGGNTSVFQASSAELTGMITYHYENVVPEPVTACLIGIGLCALGQYVRRRTRTVN
jgi:hypothetical protein